MAEGTTTQAGSSGTTAQSAGDATTQGGASGATSAAQNDGTQSQSTTGTGTTATTTTTTDDDGQAWQPERAMALINKLRPFEDKAKALERQNQELAAKLQEIEDGKKSELERAQAKSERLEKQVQELTESQRRTARESAISSAVTTAGAKYEAAMQKLVADHELLVLDQETGVPTKDSLQAVVKLLRKEMPDLFKGDDTSATQTTAGQQQTTGQVKPPPASGASTNAARSGGGAANGADANGYYRASQIEDRTFWEANKPAILQAIREGRVIADE